MFVPSTRRHLSAREHPDQTRALSNQTRAISNHERFPIKHGRFPTKHGRFPTNHGRFQPNTGASKQTRVLSNQTRALSNRPGELWAMLNVLDPERFDDAEVFLDDFGDMTSADQVQLPCVLRSLTQCTVTSVAPRAPLQVSRWCPRHAERNM